MENLKCYEGKNSEESLVLFQSNILQIRLAEDLGYELEEFVNYFSSQFRRLFENNINQTNPLKTDFEKVYGIIKIHFVRNNYSLKVDEIIED